MPAYLVADVEVTDRDLYDEYRKGVAATVAAYGGRFLVRGGAQQVVEGNLRPRTVVIEFPDLAAARACYDSPEYRAALALRLPVSLADLMIVEGCGPT